MEMNLSKSFYELCVEERLQSKEGDEIKLILKQKIEEGNLFIEQFRQSLQHCDNQIKAINQCMKDALTDVQKCALATKRTAFSHARMIWNFAANVQLISTEGKSIQLKLYDAGTDWEKSAVARQACNYMYEYAGNLNKMIGKDFLQLIEDLLGTRGYEEIKILKKPISKFFEEHREVYYGVRNTTTAHHDQDALKQIQTIDGINWISIIEDMLQFESITLPLGAFSSKLIQAQLGEMSKVFNGQ